MHGFEEKEVRNIYSGYDGWSFFSRPLGVGYDAIVTLERMNRGHREAVKILVTFDRAVPSVLPHDLTSTVRAADGTLTRQSYAVLVPRNADTSAAPSGLRIHFMKSFAIEDNELIWVKKPVGKSRDIPVNIPA